MDLSETLLAAISGAPVQGTRLLKLHTPLGHDVLLAERLELQEAIGPAYERDAPPAGLMATVHALAVNTHIELKTLLGQPVLIQLAGADASLRGWHGHICQAALLGSDGGLARYRLEVQPWLATLAHRRDAWVFQDQTVPQIVDTVFARYQGAGQLAPAWRWALADASVYPKRSLCIQYHETDLAFVQRLLREEGLFCWWEHAGDEHAEHLGSHTLVIADHNGAFEADLGTVRFTQAGAGLKADSITQLTRGARTATARLEMASPDYRTLQLRPVQQTGQTAAGLESLALIDVPGQYAYEDTAQGERLALRQMQAIDARRERVEARGSLRAAAAGSCFTLADHATHTGLDAARDRFVILSARHVARSNVSADLKARVASLAEAIALEGAPANSPADAASAKANTTEEPVYSCHLQLQRAALPVRTALLDERGLTGVRLNPRPTIQGAQTALVVGSGQPVHTDRDHRIKVQFHWQRGANGSHRLPASACDNAPANDTSGTWVRVAESVAGANWGQNFTPRVGQEVVIGFIGGDIDRPVALGSVYNGQGQADAQTNQVASGAAGSVGGAPAWFPGAKSEGKLQAHQHAAVLSGWKSQELSASTQGCGGYNQLVFDDTPDAGRVELVSSSASTRLQLGHLLNQSDNRRLQHRGHGIDMTTQAWGAVRAGAGFLVSAHQRTDSGQHIDPREPQTQLDQGRELIHTLAEGAQKHQAKLQAEPEVSGAKKQDTAKQLKAEQGLWASADSLDGVEQRAQGGSAYAEANDSSDDAGGDASGGDGNAGAENGNSTSGNQSTTIGGGAGTVSAWTKPDLLVAAPAGIGLHTPANQIHSAGVALTMAAGQDLQHLAQANHATVAKDGLILFTYGKATNANKPNAEVGITLHAASGNVNTQSLTAATKLTADKAIEVASTSGMVKVSAPNHVLLTAAGAAIELKGANITLKGPGKVEFKASMKELAGPGSASASLAMATAGELKVCEFRAGSAANGGDALVPL